MNRAAQPGAQRMLDRVLDVGPQRREVASDRWVGGGAAEDDVGAVRDGRQIAVQQRTEIHVLEDDDQGKGADDRHRSQQPAPPEQDQHQQHLDDEQGDRQPRDAQQDGEHQQGCRRPPEPRRQAGSAAAEEGDGQRHDAQAGVGDPERAHVSRDHAAQEESVGGGLEEVIGKMLRTVVGVMQPVGQLRDSPAEPGRGRDKEELDDAEEPDHAGGTEDQPEDPGEVLTTRRPEHPAVGVEQGDQDQLSEFDHAPGVSGLAVQDAGRHHEVDEQQQREGDGDPVHRDEPTQNLAGEGRGGGRHLPGALQDESRQQDQDPFFPRLENPDDKARRTQAKQDHQQEVVDRHTGHQHAKRAKWNTENGDQRGTIQHQQRDGEQDPDHVFASNAS